MLSKLVFVPVGALVLSVASLAAADPARADASEIPRQDYAYEFPDEPLAGLPRGATGAAIHVRHGVVRRTLLRPRLHFVPEMLKSVETI